MAGIAMRLSELARRLDCRLEGDPEGVITGIAALGDAGDGDLSLFTDARLASLAGATRAKALLLGWETAAPTPLGAALLRSRNPEASLAQAIAMLRPPWRPERGIDPRAAVHATARLGANAYVGPFAVIGEGCAIGDDALIHAHSVLYPGVRAGARFTAHAHAVVREGTVLGDDVTLQPGVVLGGDGFGFARQADGTQLKIPQVGGVEIGDGVEIQANSCVDRGTLGATRIGSGSKLDNLVQVAHNCEVGAHTVLCAQVGVAGSTRIGEGAVLAGQAGVAGHCTVGAGTVITAQSGTHGDLEPGRIYSGSPAFDHAAWLRSTAAFARLGEMARELRSLRARLDTLEGKAKSV